MVVRCSSSYEVGPHQLKDVVQSQQSRDGGEGEWGCSHL